MSPPVRQCTFLSLSPGVLFRHAGMLLLTSAPCFAAAFQEKGGKTTLGPSVRREEAFVHLFPAHHRHVKKKPILSPWFRHMFLSERDFVALWAMESFFTSIHWLFFSFFSPKNMCKWSISLFTPKRDPVVRTPFLFNRVGCVFLTWLRKTEYSFVTWLSECLWI